MSAPRVTKIASQLPSPRPSTSSSTSTSSVISAMELLPAYMSDDATNPCKLGLAKQQPMTSIAHRASPSSIAGAMSLEQMAVCQEVMRLLKTHEYAESFAGADWQVVADPISPVTASSSNSSPASPSLSASIASGEQPSHETQQQVSSSSSITSQQLKPLPDSRRRQQLHQPMDLTTVEARLTRYSSPAAFMKDLRLIFIHARAVWTNEDDIVRRQAAALESFLDWQLERIDSKFRPAFSSIIAAGAPSTPESSVDGDIELLLSPDQLRLPPPHLRAIGSSHPSVSRGRTQSISSSASSSSAYLVRATSQPFSRSKKRILSPTTSSPTRAAKKIAREDELEDDNDDDYLPDADEPDAIDLFIGTPKSAPRRLNGRRQSSAVPFSYQSAATLSNESMSRRDSNVSDVSTVASGPKKRGRPKKVDVNGTASLLPALPKGKRGRPKKNPLPSYVELPAVAPAAPGTNLNLGEPAEEHGKENSSKLLDEAAAASKAAYAATVAAAAVAAAAMRAGQDIIDCDDNEPPLKHSSSGRRPPALLPQRLTRLSSTDSGAPTSPSYLLASYFNDLSDTATSDFVVGDTSALPQVTMDLDDMNSESASSITSVPEIDERRKYQQIRRQNHLILDQRPEGFGEYTPTLFDVLPLAPNVAAMSFEVSEDEDEFRGESDGGVYMRGRKPRENGTGGGLFGGEDGEMGEEEVFYDETEGDDAMDVDFDPLQKHGPRFILRVPVRDESHQISSRGSGDKTGSGATRFSTRTRTPSEKGAALALSVGTVAPLPTAVPATVQIKQPPQHIRQQSTPPPQALPSPSPSPSIVSTGALVVESPASFSFGSTATAFTGSASGQVIGRLTSGAQKPLSLNPKVQTAVDKPSSSSGSGSGSARHCTFCGTRTTPMWRHGPAGFDPLCNGCGVKWKRGRILRGCERAPLSHSASSSSRSRHTSSSATAAAAAASAAVEAISCGAPAGGTAASLASLMMKSHLGPLDDRAKAALASSEFIDRANLDILLSSSPPVVSTSVPNARDAAAKLASVQPRELTGSVPRTAYLISALALVPSTSLPFVAAGLRRIVGSSGSGTTGSGSGRRGGESELEMDVGEMSVNEWGDVCGFLLGVRA